jgi:hypothetical protein
MDGMEEIESITSILDCALANVLDAARSLPVSAQDLSQGTDAQLVNTADSFI